MNKFNWWIFLTAITVIILVTNRCQSKKQGLGIHLKFASSRILLLCRNRNRSCNLQNYLKCMLHPRILAIDWTCLPVWSNSRSIWKVGTLRPIASKPYLWFVESTDWPCWYQSQVRCWGRGGVMFLFALDYPRIVRKRQIEFRFARY